MTERTLRPGAESAGTRSRRRVLTLLVVGNAVSLSGNVIMTVAIPWLVLTTTGSAAVAGGVVFAGVASAAIGGLGRVSQSA